jgi:hypothetical protein
MNPASPAQTTATALRDTDGLQPFAIPKGGELVVVPPPKNLTLADVERGIRGLTSVESRVAKIFDDATRHFGAGANNAFTRFADRKGWVIGTSIAAGVLATGAYWALGFPTSAEYDYYYSQHVVTHSSYGWDVTKALAGMLVAGTAATVGGLMGTPRLNKLWKAHMARDTLKLDHLRKLTAISKNAEHRPLQRAAIARVASKALNSLGPRQIYADPEVKEMLKKAAADINLGDDVAKAEAQRHTALVNAVDLVCKEKVVDGAIRQLISAFTALTPEERESVRPGLIARLFDGVVGRNRHMRYDQAEYLLAQLQG